MKFAFQKNAKVKQVVEKQISKQEFNCAIKLKILVKNNKIKVSVGSLEG